MARSAAPAGVLVLPRSADDPGTTQPLTVTPQSGACRRCLNECPEGDLKLSEHKPLTCGNAQIGGSEHHPREHVCSSMDICVTPVLPREHRPTCQLPR